MTVTCPKCGGNRFRDTEAMRDCRHCPDCGYIVRISDGAVITEGDLPSSEKTMMTMAVCERPILFSGAMVRAILDGKKTQTRRVVKFRNGRHIVAAPEHDGVFEWWPVDHGGIVVKQSREVMLRECPYGVVGDRLWVRESWAIKNWTDKECTDMGFANAPQHPTEVYLGTPTRAVHRANWQPEFDGHIPECVQKWKPSIHMPRWASRLTLELTGVRVEQVQDISESDAKAEGVEALGSAVVVRGPNPFYYRDEYSSLWNSLNAKRGYGWDENPWVWVLEFRRVEANHV